MSRRFLLPGELSLATVDPRPSGLPGNYPTDGLQKGLVLLDGEHELGGEGVGFGVPVLKVGARTAFSGSSTVIHDDAGQGSLTLSYRIDRVERLSSSDRPPSASSPLDLIRDSLSVVYRYAPPLRRPLTAASRAGRRLLRLRTRYVETTPLAEVSVTYDVRAGTREGEGCLHVTARLGELPPGVTEVVLMNELGACFDLYEEDGRVERAGGIGAWDQVRAPAARFRSSDTGVWFELQSRPDPATPQVRLFRGREVAPGRLAWAGFGYSLRPVPPAFSYSVRCGRDPLRSEEPHERGGVRP